MKANNGYSYSRAWFDFAFDSTEVKPVHTALFFWIVELNNRLGWKEQFGLPTMVTMEGLSIGNKRTYLAALNDLCTWGFVEIVSESKNQYNSTLIKLCCGKKATAKVTALDTAMQRQGNSTGHSEGHSTAPIDKQRNNETKKPRNNETRFTPPNEDEVFNFMSMEVTSKRLEWDEKKISSEAAKFFNYYESKGWLVGSSKMKSWNAAARKWMSSTNFEPNNKTNNGTQSTREARQTELERFKAEQIRILTNSNFTK